MSRPETGPMQFGDDWPGVFIRGDNAIAYAMYLRSLLKGTAGPLERVMVESLSNILIGCDVRMERPPVQQAQLIEASRST